MLKNNKKILFIIPLIIIAAALAYYFLYWCKTPLYAVNEVRTAVQQHNVEKFEKHVDLHSVLDKAFEDVIVAESKINNDAVAANPFALGILHMLKPAVVELMVEEAKSAVAGSSKDNNADAAAKNDAANVPAPRKNPVTDAMRNNIEKKLNLDQLKISDIILESTQNNNAIVDLQLHHKTLDKDFSLKLKMTVNEEGNWQIKEITNLEEFLIQLDAAQKSAQASHDKPVLEKLQSSLEILDQKLAIKTENDKHILSALITIKNTTNKNINRIYYDIDVFDSNNNIIYSYPEHFNGILPPGNTQILNNHKILNKSLPADKTLMSLDFAKLNWKIQPTYISFDDGEVLEYSRY